MFRSPTRFRALLARRLLASMIALGLLGTHFGEIRHAFSARSADDLTSHAGCHCSPARKLAGRCCCAKRDDAPAAPARSCCAARLAANDRSADSEQCEPKAEDTKPVGGCLEKRCGCSGPDGWLAGADPRLDAPRPMVVQEPTTPSLVDLVDDRPACIDLAPATPPPRTTSV